MAQPKIILLQMFLFFENRSSFHTLYIFHFRMDVKYFLRNMNASLLSDVHNGDVYNIVTAVARTILKFVPLFRVNTSFCH